MRQLHAIWFLVTTGIAALSDVGMSIIDGTKLKFRSAVGALGVRTVLDDSDIVATLSGNQANKVPSVAAVKAITDLAVTSIAAGSSSMLQITAGALSVTPLLMTRPVIDAVSISLTAALAARTPVYNLANVGNNTADLQMGDTLILTAATGGTQVWLHNGGVLGTAADFTSIEASPVSNAAIRALFSGANGITYNSGTGQFKLGGTLTEATTLETSTFGFSIARTDGGGLTNELSISPLSKSIRMKGGGGEIEIGLSAIGIAINGATASILDLRTIKIGLEYAGDYTATFVARSLVDRGYVDAKVLAAVGKANVTVTTTAGVWTNVVHNFALGVGNFDNFVVSCYDSTGELVGLRVKTLDANTIQVMTAEAVVGLRVRMIKTA